MKNYITTITRTEETFRIMAAALYAMGYKCNDDSLETYSGIGYGRIFIYKNGDLGGNSGDGSIKTDVANSVAIGTALKWMLEKPVELKLNSTYTAVIKGGEVLVGCQRFPASKVLELAKLIEGGK